jgi:hypothetical protein
MWPQQPVGSQYRGAPQQPVPQQPNAQQPSAQQPTGQQPTGEQPSGQVPGQQPWWNQQPSSGSNPPAPRQPNGAAPQNPTGAAPYQQPGPAVPPTTAHQQNRPTPPAEAPTRQYPSPTAPTERFGAPGGQAAPSTPGSQQAPGRPPGQNGAPGQGYPVQYAAGPGQQHSATPGFGPYGQQPGSATSPGSPTDTSKKRRFSWGAAAVGLLAGAAVGALITLAVTGQFVRPVFTGASVEDGVQGVLEDEFGLPDVGDVSCPEEPSAAAGAEFACAFTTGDREFSVQVRVLDSGGQYLVGAVSSGD